MSIKALVTQGTIVGVPVANQITNDGIITALELESLVFLGMTGGAWLQLAMFISLLLVIFLNLNKAGRECARLYNKVKLIWSTGKKSVQLEEAAAKEDRRSQE